MTVNTGGISVEMTTTKKAGSASHVCISVPQINSIPCIGAENARRRAMDIKQSQHAVLTNWQARDKRVNLVRNTEICSCSVLNIVLLRVARSYSCHGRTSVPQNGSLHGPPDDSTSSA
jgi:hypothetical protein